MTAPQIALREAIDWHVVLQEGDTDRWHAFVDWLEADETHRTAYDHVALDDALLDGRPAPRRSAALAAAPPRRTVARRAWAAGIVAAMMAGTAFVTLRPSHDGRYVIESPADAARTVALADGTQVQLNRGARLMLDRNDPRLAVLERGEAMFRVHHDAAAPFQVEAGGRVIQDVGTVFNVVATGQRVDVSVAEGSVLYQPGRDKILLKPGMALSSPTPGEARVQQIATSAVGGWTRGRLEFSDAPLGDVADALGRSLGVTVRLAPALEGHRFSGTLRSDRSPADAIHTLAALSGSVATRRGGDWLLTAESGGAS
jgi:transmembrane sensor